MSWSVGWNAEGQVYLELVCNYFNGKHQMCAVLFHPCLSVIEFSAHIWFLELKIIFLVDYIAKQEDLLDLITALLKFNCFLSTTVTRQYTFQRILWWFITVDTTSLGQHKLYYCTISRSRCEMCDEVIVLIWNFLRDMYGHEDMNTINNSFLS